jgi:hypothetical protein
MTLKRESTHVKRVAEGEEELRLSVQGVPKVVCRSPSDRSGLICEWGES